MGNSANHKESRGFVVVVHVIYNFPQTPQVAIRSCKMIPQG